VITKTLKLQIGKGMVPCLRREKNTNVVSFGQRILKVILASSETFQNLVVDPQVHLTIEESLFLPNVVQIRTHSEVYLIGYLLHNNRSAVLVHL